MTRFRFSDEPLPPRRAGSGDKNKSHPVIWAEMLNLSTAGDVGEVQALEFATAEEKEKALGVIKGYASQLKNIRVMVRVAKPRFVWLERKY